MVFGKSKYDKAFEKELKNLWSWITQLNKNQAVLIKNNNIRVGKIAKMEKDNVAQRQFDTQVSETIKNLDAKLNNALELAKHLKELRQQVAALQQSSHSHKEE